MRSPFEPWLEGKQSLPNRFYTKGIGDQITEDDWLCWVSPVRRVPLYDAGKLKWLSLRESRRTTAQYLGKAAKIIGGLEGGSLDRWEREEMEASGLVAPELCCPIYLVTCESDSEENICYVGLTTASNRFKGGHAAALKLHHSKFNGLSKWVYQCVVCLANDDYVFLEWLDPYEVALSVLKDVESQLIFDLQPELNTSKRRSHAARTPLRIHMQQTLPETRLKDIFFDPPKR